MPEQNIPEEVILSITGLSKQFYKDISIITMTGGLINHTFKITWPNQSPLLLQKLNNHVFNKPRDVQHNYISAWKFLPSLKLPAPHFWNDGESLFTDSIGNQWRAFEFISNSKMLGTAVSPAIAGTTAEAFARLTAALKNFDAGILKTIIPGFHDLSLRYSQFEASVKSPDEQRKFKGAHLIKELQRRTQYRDFYDHIARSDDYPLRVMHHDAKISNVLFHQKTEEVICVIDMDTLMPGYYFSDLGDMIRSMVSPTDENNSNTGEIIIRKGYYEAMIGNYLEILAGHLTTCEKRNIHLAGPLMIYMQALRFMTDYLEGDIYYQTKYPDQNFDRAFNQLILLEKLENFLIAQYAFSPLIP